MQTGESAVPVDAGGDSASESNVASTHDGHAQASTLRRLTPLPLPGRVVVRELAPQKVGLVWLPDQHYDNKRDEEKSRGKLARSSHSARVLAMGPPASTRIGAPIEPGFAVGDEVIYVYHANEAMRRREWVDGEPCLWLSQEEIIAVVEAP